MRQEKRNTFFAPQLYIPQGIYNIDFYIMGMGAKELRRFSNSDGSIHVSELSIKGCIFHLHEENPGKGQFNPLKNNGVTALIGLFVESVDDMVSKAVKAGATVLVPAQDYDYGYRQAEFRDPFGHVWLIEQKL